MKRNCECGGELKSLFQTLTNEGCLELYECDSCHKNYDSEDIHKKTAFVWQRKDPGFQEKPGVFPDDYEFVAEVYVGYLKVKKHFRNSLLVSQRLLLGRALELTNSIECPWWENDNVRAIKQSRSTSVGDIIELDDKRYLRAIYGWEKV